MKIHFKNESKIQTSLNEAKTKTVASRPILKEMLNEVILEGREMTAEGK